eukprot:Rmarinus@m.25403
MEEFRRLWDVRDLCVTRLNSVPSENSPHADQVFFDSQFVSVANEQPLQPVLSLEDLIGLSETGEGTNDMQSRANLERFLINCWNMWGYSSSQFVLRNGKEAAFSRLRHPMIDTKQSKVDIMFALYTDHLNYPVLLMELMSVGDSSSQVVKKAVAQLALCAELAWDENLDPYIPESDEPPIPTSLCALALPGYGADSPILKITVSWDHSRLNYVVSYEAQSVYDVAGFQTAVRHCLDINRPVYQYLFKRVVRDGIRPSPKFQFRTVYRLSSAELLYFNESLGNSNDTLLRQLSSDTAFVFVRLSNDGAKRFYKISDTLETAMQRIESSHCDLQRLSECLVLPVDPAGELMLEPRLINDVPIYTFPAHDALVPNELLTLFPLVVSSLETLHSLGFAHTDVRRENMVRTLKRVKFIDLDRIRKLRSRCSYCVGSIWYPLHIRSAEKNRLVSIRPLSPPRMHRWQWENRTSFRGCRPGESRACS